MTENLQEVIDVIESLSANDQLELIATVSCGLQEKYQLEKIAASLPEFAPLNSIPPDIKRSTPLKNLSQLKADFWPEDETADDINKFIEQQRRGYDVNQ